MDSSHRRRPGADFAGLSSSPLSVAVFVLPKTISIQRGRALHTLTFEVAVPGQSCHPSCQGMHVKRCHLACRSACRGSSSMEDCASTLTPLMNKMPIVGAAQFSLVQMPEFR